MPDSATRTARRPHAALAAPGIDAGALRARLDDVLRPFVLGAPPGATGGSMTERRVAETARDAASAVVPLLGEPARSAERVRRLVAPVLTCGWGEFDARYAAALDAILALPPAVPGVDDPAWDAGLAQVAPPRAAWVGGGPAWTPGDHGAEVVGPGGTPGRVVRRGREAVLVTGDGRSVRVRAQCACALADRRARPEVAFEHVHLRRNGSILGVTVGSACGACRAPIA